MIILIQALILALGLDHRFFASERGFLSVSIAEIVAYAVLGVMSVEVLRSIRWNLSVQTGLRGPGGLTTRLYLMWVFLAAATGWFLFSNSDGLHSLKDAMPALILFSAIRFWARSTNDVRRISRAVALTLTLLSVLAFSQYLFGGPHLNPMQDNSFDKFAIGGEERVVQPVVGTFASPNSFAVFFAPLFIFCLTSYLELGSSRVEKAGLIFMFAALVLTQAKLVLGVTILTGLSALILCGFRVRPRGSISAGVLVASLVGLTVAIGFLILNEASLPEGLTMGTMRGRLGLAAEGVFLLQRYSDVALFGGGIELYRELLPISFHVHNEYLDQALMWGLPGAALFSWLFIRASWVGKTVLWTTKLPVVAAILILLVESAGGTQRQGMLFLVLGIAMVEVVRPSSEVAPTAPILGTS